MHKLSVAALAAAFLVAAGPPVPSVGVGQARAQEPDSAARGLAAARRWCAGCHIVEAGQTRQALDAAPPFSEIARDPNMPPARLRGFLSNPHGRMPTDALTRDDIAGLVAYIESLRN